MTYYVHNDTEQPVVFDVVFEDFTLDPGKTVGLPETFACVLPTVEKPKGKTVVLDYLP